MSQSLKLSAILTCEEKRWRVGWSLWYALHQARVHVSRPVSSSPPPSMPSFRTGQKNIFKLSYWQYFPSALDIPPDGLQFTESCERKDWVSASEIRGRWAPVHGLQSSEVTRWWRWEARTPESRLKKRQAEILKKERERERDVLDAFPLSSTAASFLMFRIWWERSSSRPCAVALVFLPLSSPW